MSDQASGGDWKLQRIENSIDDLKAQQHMTDEAFKAFRDDRDDWDREQEIKRLLFEKDQVAKAMVTGKDAEDAQRQVEALHVQIADLAAKVEKLLAALDAKIEKRISDVEVKVDQHANSHRLRDKEHLDRVEELQKERIKSRTALWVQIIVTAGIVLAALIGIVPHLIK